MAHVANHNEATITIERRTSFQDALRSYVVRIDRQEVGRLRRGRAASYSVEPGHHAVSLSMPGSATRSRSEDVELDLRPNEAVVLRTRSHGARKLLTLPLAIFFPDRFAPRPWILLAVSD